MFGKVFLAVYILVQILISVLTEYSVNNSPTFRRIGEKTKIIRIAIKSGIIILTKMKILIFKIIIMKRKKMKKMKI